MECPNYCKTCGSTNIILTHNILRCGGCDKFTIFMEYDLSAITFYYFESNIDGKIYTFRSWGKSFYDNKLPIIYMDNIFVSFEKADQFLKSVINIKAFL